MKYVETRDIPLGDIEIGPRGRRVDPDEVERIKTSMAEIGQATAIAVVGQLSGPKYRLLAGAHRVAAAVALGWPAIRAEIKEIDENMSAGLAAELEEIDENLGRHDLNYLDRANSAGRRMAILKEIYPERFQRGGDRKGADYREKSNRDDPGLIFAQETAALLGKDESTVRRALAIYELDDSLRQRIAGTPLAKKEGELFALTRQEPAKREQIVDVLLAAYAADDGKTPSVKAIAADLEGRPDRIKPKHELDREQLIDRFKRADKKGKAGFLHFLVEIGVVPRFDSGQL